MYFKGNVNALVWYSPQQLEKLGIAEPKTWAEFTAAMDKAKADGVAPLAVGGKDGWPLTQWTDPVILRVAGAEAFNDLARGKIGWDDPRIVKSFQVLGDLIGKLLPAADALATGFIDATCAGAKGKALFDNQGAFLNLIIPAECDKSLKPGKDFTFFLMPKYDASMPEAQFVSGDLFVGAKDTKNEAGHAAPCWTTWLGRRPGDLGQARRLHRPQRQGAGRRLPGRERPQGGRAVAQAAPTSPPATTSTTGSAARSRSSTGRRSPSSPATRTSTSSSPR